MDIEGTLNVFEFEKLKSAVEVLLSEPRTPAPGGMDELCHALWYADCEIARDRGRSITGSVYVLRGSAPWSRALCWAIEALIAEGRIASGAASFLYFHQADLKLLRGNHLNALDDVEIAALKRAHSIVFEDRIGGGRLTDDDYRVRMLKQGKVDPLLASGY
ncbi:hypothetical protein [Burkholderia pseudomallei]|uniref:hypothetical protein n=1 Tax=Burkholderia pseudomallei TaxID=28450 RepID=UPI00052A2272|nr:hypothetical protein [Burkholderia pseudomallei]AIV63774.1 hypothetical protein X993_3358 [Burkholderia pseudomallei K42]